MARKLVKEMEDHKASRASRVSVRNRYTIFLCEEDYDRLSAQRDELIGKLERHLTKHVRSKRYEIAGKIMVDIVVDGDLRLGRFGILAERQAPGFAEQDLPARLTREAPLEDSLPLAAESGSQARSARVSQVRAAAREIQPSVAPFAPPAEPAAKPTRSRPADATSSGTTRIIAPDDAAQLGLARDTIIIRSGNRVREYSQGRVVIGRAAEADFRIDNPDVSRRHAAIYWSNGQVMLEDLGSTNGTMVNGYPISSAVVAPQDVVVIGDCRMCIETR